MHHLSLIWLESAHVPLLSLNSRVICIFRSTLLCYKQFIRLFRACFKHFHTYISLQTATEFSATQQLHKPIFTSSINKIREANSQTAHHNTFAESIKKKFDRDDPIRFLSLSKSFLLDAEPSFAKFTKILFEFESYVSERLFTLFSTKIVLVLNFNVYPIYYQVIH